VAFSARHIFEHIIDAGGEIDEVRYSGGLARLPAVGRVLAHVLQRPVAIPAEFETTSVGAYLITAKAMGRYASLQEGCDDVVALERVYSPDGKLAALYDDYFALYKELYNQTRELQRLRKGLVARFPTLLDLDATVRENL
jgi:sugar (pentulose or hexulose) kinase